MKKENIINFIDLVLNKLNLDQISETNYNNIKNILKEIPLYKFKKFNKIILKSEPIINKMLQNYKLFDINSFIEQSIESTNFNSLRNELNYYPSFDKNKAFDFINKLNNIKNKYKYILHIDNIKINLFFYSQNKDNILFFNLARIIFTFIKTFGQNSNIYNNYNIRLLLIDFPRKLDNNKCSCNNCFKKLSEQGYFNNSSGVHIQLQKELVVSRKSGITGLLIHELIHMLGLDFCFNLQEKQQVNLRNWTKNWVDNNNIIDKNHNIISFIESICNTNSSYFVSIYNAIHTCSIIKNDKQVLKFFKYYFYIESIYCFINGVKLLNYFNFNTFDSFFNNTTNKIFYQNALVFEYIILRMFLIDNYYKFLLKPLLNNNYNELTNSKINYEIQDKLNNKMIKNVNKKSIKNLFDNISINMDKIDGYYIEYFPIDLLNSN